MPSRPPKQRSRTWSIVAVTAVVALTVVGIAVGMKRMNDRNERSASEARAWSAEWEAEEKAKADALEQKAAEQAAAAWQDSLVKIDRPTGRPLTVEVYGDSVTYGMDATAEENTYRHRLGKALAAADPVEYIVKAWPGARASDMIRDVDPRAGIDLSIIALGLNDAFKKTPLDRFRRDYQRQLADVFAAAPKTVLVCEGLWQSRKDLAYRPYDEAIEEICVAAGGTYIQLSQDFDDPTTHGPADLPSAFMDKKSDSTHPNDLGMRVIFYRLAERLPSLIASPSPAPEGFLSGPDWALVKARDELGVR